ncbi:MAG TPA: DoxX family protein [Thermoanaerobaculia bacterium]|jgi:putative oxidoreductase|nr:DoxX family protein [Thermoanaerobaculia bacterium]
MSLGQRAGWLGTLLAWREKTDWIPPLLARLTLGIIFAESGWGKLHNLPRVIAFFTELGIPAPSIQAPFVAGVEFVGGLLIFIGLFTRIAAIPLSATMLVAIATAKMGDVHSIGDFAGLSEWAYFVLLMWLAWAGAGKVSLDALITGRRGKSA